MIRSYKDLEIYNRSYKLASDIFWLTRKFPKEEVYSLTSQIVRSSRSISANISESVFKQHLIHALGSNTETQTWLSFAKDCKYLTDIEFNKMNNETDEIGKMLTKLHQKWKSNI